VPELAGTVRMRMAGDDLLDQAGAGARHADDEDGPLRRVAVIFAAGEEVAVEMLQHAVDAVLRHLRVEWRATRMHAVAALEMFKCTGGFAMAIMPHAERELHVHAVDFGHVTIGSKLLQLPAGPLIQRETAIGE